MQEDLTTREWQVLELVATGKANKEIAYGLRMAEDTVKHHVSDILRKLGVESRVGAARWYLGHARQE